MFKVNLKSIHTLLQPAESFKPVMTLPVMSLDSMNHLLKSMLKFKLGLIHTFLHIPSFRSIHSGGIIQVIHLELPIYSVT